MAVPSKHRQPPNLIPCHIFCLYGICSFKLQMCYTCMEDACIIKVFYCAWKRENKVEYYVPAKMRHIYVPVSSVTEESKSCHKATGSRTWFIWL